MTEQSEWACVRDLQAFAEDLQFMHDYDYCPTSKELKHFATLIQAVDTELDNAYNK